MTQTEACTLHWFLERDIDMFLAEELRVNPALSEWFARQAAPGVALLYPATQTRVSVPENGGRSAAHRAQTARLFAMILFAKIFCAKYEWPLR